MGLLAKLVGVSIKQGLLMALIAALPMWWWGYAVRASPRARVNNPNSATSHSHDDNRIRVRDPDDPPSPTAPSVRRPETHHVRA